MITWKNRRIEDLTAAELRLALEDAASEIVHAQRIFGQDQMVTALLAGFVVGAALTALALTLPQILH